jgi:copper chaperone CopZ
VEDIEGVMSVQGDAMNKKITIKWDNPATWERIADTLRDIGYPAA